MIANENGRQSVVKTVMAINNTSIKRREKHSAHDNEWGTYTQDVMIVDNIHCITIGAHRAGQYGGVMADDSTESRRCHRRR